MNSNVVRAIGLAVVLSGGVAYADSQVDIATRENDDGKELMYAGNYTDASAKFRDAVARVPEPKYFFNLCTSLFQEGKFGEALTSCLSAAKANTDDKGATRDDKLKDKIDKLTARIQDEATAQGLDLKPVGGGGGDPNLPPPSGGNGLQAPPPDPNAGNGGGPPPDPNAGNGGGQPTGPGPGPNVGQPVARYQPVVGRPPEQNLFKAVHPDHNYTWTLGIDVFGGGASFQGQVNNANAFGNAAGGFRVKSDYMLNRRARVGAEVWLSYTSVTSNADAMTTATVGELDILDAGIGVYKHLCLKGVERLCLTPLVGASLAFMDPNQNIDDSGMQTFNYLGLGLRANLAAEYAFGRRYEHVLSVGVDARYYTAAFSDPTDGSPTRADVGLDQGGTVVTLNIGYTYRFNTPLGGRAFITLE
nr:hypothetical protein [Kofleriaceae bacterium]